MIALSSASIRLETCLLIEWQLLTWVRPGEAVRALWSDIDGDNRFWNIPGEFMKMKRPHKIPLSKEAIRILELIRPISGHRGWIFPSIKVPLKHMHEQTANAAIIRMGFGGELVAHGMRSIARTAAEESGKFRIEVLESALAHTKNNEIIAAYNRAEYLLEREVLMQWWGDYVQTQKHKILAA
nr:tyrosine-type recombinase/integrase [Candidatus Symbiopectobacterium sp. PLON1]